ncbi:ABC-three component system middle component 6 [Planomicrobium sp. Y74]|uniref:ABC-three component system middle component 6 n=1 Tax=Planomicrobium sp. Y74 TaxID=2478977 RepID=UPI000EF4456E|nr:ABC-three component system middle component 6 [Planomicrobium sp. Y74]RLQ91955.1 hypothetical protein D9754_03990 [Planomicrobium sp. Y74]
MILPNKYISNSQSLIGLSALVLNALSNKSLSIDKLWKSFEKKYINNHKLNTAPTYQKFLLTLNFMYLIGMINYTEEGDIYNENLEINNKETKSGTYKRN